MCSPIVCFMLYLSSVLFFIILYNKPVHFSTHLVTGLTADTGLFIAFSFLPLLQKGRYNEMSCFDGAFLFAGFLGRPCDLCVCGLFCVGGAIKGNEPWNMAYTVLFVIKEFIPLSWPYS